MRKFGGADFSYVFADVLVLNNFLNHVVLIVSLKARYHTYSSFTNTQLLNTVLSSSLG